MNILKDCVSCDLRNTCTQVVLPRIGGNKYMFVGEAPGEAEDLQGKVFVGRSGKLLAKILNEAGFKSSEVYVTNTVKCRPPKNRTPTTKEIEVCGNLWLWPEFVRIKPKYVFMLGKTPASFFLGTKPNKIKIKDIFETEYTIRTKIDDISYESKGYVLYHPSYLLQHGRKLVNKQIELLKGIYDKSV